jgi:hypothetical protein
MFLEYGGEFLRVMASLYPGYKASGTFIDVIVGMLYALVDGVLSWFVIALLYNVFVGKAPKRRKNKVQSLRVVMQYAIKGPGYKYACLGVKTWAISSRTAKDRRY